MPEMLSWCIPGDVPGRPVPGPTSSHVSQRKPGAICQSCPPGISLPDRPRPVACRRALLFGCRPASPPTRRGVHSPSILVACFPEKIHGGLLREMKGPAHRSVSVVELFDPLAEPRTPRYMLRSSPRSRTPEDAWDLLRYFSDISTLVRLINRS